MGTQEPNKKNALKSLTNDMTMLWVLKSLTNDMTMLWVLKSLTNDMTMLWVPESLTNDMTMLWALKSLTNDLTMLWVLKSLTNDQRMQIYFLTCIYFIIKILFKTDVFFIWSNSKSRFNKMYKHHQVHYICLSIVLFVHTISPLYLFINRTIRTHNKSIIFVYQSYYSYTQ